MNNSGWILARAITLVGIMVGLDNFLPAVTSDAQAESLNVKPGHGK